MSISAADLKVYLEVLREAGVTRGQVPIQDSDGVYHGMLQVEFGPVTQRAGGTDVPASPFVDKEGNPVDLDEGNPWVDRIAAANAKPVKPGA